MSTPSAKSNELRTIIALAVIAGMVCVGAYTIIYDPIAKKLLTAKAEETALTSQVRAAEVIRDTLPQVTAAVQKAAADASQINDTGRFAREEQELYAALTSLASKHRVRIDQMTPTLTSEAKGSSGSTSATDAAQGTTVVAYTIDATATYVQMAAFIRSLRTEVGYCNVRTVRITPTSETRQKLVHAFIETEHYSFEASPISLSANAAPEGAH